KKKEKKNTVKRMLGFMFNDVRNVAWEDELATFIAPTKENKGKKIKSLKYQLADMRKLGVKNNKYQPFRACIYTVDYITKETKENKKKIQKYQLDDMRKLGVKNNKYQPFRACIYNVDSITKEPKEKIYRSQKVKMTKNEKWFYVHIDSLDIRMPKEG